VNLIEKEHRITQVVQRLEAIDGYGPIFAPVNSSSGPNTLRPASQLGHSLGGKCRLTVSKAAYDELHSATHILVEHSTVSSAGSGDSRDVSPYPREDGVSSEDENPDQDHARTSKNRSGRTPVRPNKGKASNTAVVELEPVSQVQLRLWEESQEGIHNGSKGVPEKIHQHG
jgi:hypothetical protein